MWPRPRACIFPLLFTMRKPRREHGPRFPSWGCRSERAIKSNNEITVIIIPKLREPHHLGFPCTWCWLFLSICCKTTCQALGPGVCGILSTVARRVPGKTPMVFRPVRSGGRMIYRFADCVLDTHLYTLQRADQSTRLAPKVFEVLCYLIEHRDRVVSRQELCEQVWAGSAITDATLESCLRGVRLTVGDSGRAQRIIQTQRGYGYRFVADVALLPDDPSTPPLPPEAVPSLTPPPVSPGVRPCAACQHANHEDATFCAACGMRLRQPCAHCGRDSLLPAAFCTACGQSLVAPSPPGSVPPLALAPELAQTVVTPSALQEFGAERKLVTVLCCTVVSTAAGGTPFELDILYSVMQELHDLVHDAARPYGGR